MFVVCMFVVFSLMLMGLMVFHHHKLWCVALGFTVLSVAFMLNGSVGDWLEHFGDHHRSHLLINLALLLPGFALAAHYFEHSGSSKGLAKVLTSDVALLWAIFGLSTILDNIAAAMIGGTILMARYGQGNVPFSMLVGVIGASNLGGAGSPVGDTTTVMMFISESPSVPVVQIAAAMVAAFPAQALLVWWAVRHNAVPIALNEETWRKEAAHLDQVAHAPTEGALDVRAEEDAAALSEGALQKSMQWKMVLPLLAVPGLIVGNIFDQPGIGLWSGLLAGILLGWNRFEWRACKDALPNTLFLVLLVAAAEMLPLTSLIPTLQDMMAQGVWGMIALIVLIGIASAFFDNIPLMAVCLSLGALGVGLDWGLTAYCLGYEGSAMWFGSSAGVALGLQYKEVYDTKRWVKPYLAVTTSYLAGVLVYVAVFYGVVPWVREFSRVEGLAFFLGLTFLCWMIAGAFELLSSRRNMPAILVFGTSGVCSLFVAFWWIAQ